MSDAELNVWQRVLVDVQGSIPSDEWRRWLSATGYASDSGDQITVWVPTDAARRHIELNYHDTLRRSLARMGRPQTVIRLVVSGDGGEEDEDDKDEVTG